MQFTQQPITIEKLNQRYIRIIKLFLEGKIDSRTTRLQEFMSEPNPNQSFILLQKIYQQANARSQKEKKQINKEAEQQISSEMLGKNLKKINSSNESRQNLYQSGDKDKEEKALKLKNIQSNKSSENQGIYEPKVQTIRRLTGKLTQLFTENQIKIEKHQQSIKQKTNPPQESHHHSEARFAKPVEIGFRKY